MLIQPILRVYRGLPGSGKTTHALAWIAAAPERRFRVNRDGMRHAMLGSPDGGDSRFVRRRLSRAQEAAVTVAQHAAAAALLAAGLDVAVDDTNLNGEHLTAWTMLARNNGAQLDMVDLTGVPVEVCVARDARRGADRVGEDIIRGMWGNFRRPDRQRGSGG